jgi:hypothetical protein
MKMPKPLSILAENCYNVRLVWWSVFKLWGRQAKFTRLAIKRVR